MCRNLIMFTCRICKQPFNTIRKYNLHMYYHRNLRSADFTCCIKNCHLAFKTFKAFETHNNRHHSSRHSFENSNQAFYNLAKNCENPNYTFSSDSKHGVQEAIFFRQKCQQKRTLPPCSLPLRG